MIAETTIAAKASSPFKTDIQLLGLLRKRAAASKAAAQEFGAAKRDDLQQKELDEAAIMEEYASGVETVGEAEITLAIRAATVKLQGEGKSVNPGTVIKELCGSQGTLVDGPVEKREIVRLVEKLRAGERVAKAV